MNILYLETYIFHTGWC